MIIPLKLDVKVILEINGMFQVHESLSDLFCNQKTLS